AAGGARRPRAGVPDRGRGGDPAPGRPRGGGGAVAARMTGPAAACPGAAVGFPASAPAAGEFARGVAPAGGELRQDTLFSGGPWPGRLAPRSRSGRQGPRGVRVYPRTGAMHTYEASGESVDGGPAGPDRSDRGGGGAGRPPG